MADRIWINNHQIRQPSARPSSNKKPKNKGRNRMNTRSMLETSQGNNSPSNKYSRRKKNVAEKKTTQNDKNKIPEKNGKLRKMSTLEIFLFSPSVRNANPTKSNFVGSLSPHINACLFDRCLNKIPISFSWTAGNLFPASSFNLL